MASSIQKLDCDSPLVVPLSNFFELEDFFFASYFGIAVCSTDHRILRANRAFQDLFGYTEIELGGACVECLFAGILSYPTAATPCTHDKLHSTELCGLLCNRKAGTSFFADLNILEHIPTGKKEPCMLLQIRNVTPRETALHELRQSQARLRLALAAAKIGLWDWELRTGQHTFNDIIFEMFGYKPNEISITNDFWIHSVHSDDLPNQIRNWTNHLQGFASEYRQELRIKHKDGSWRWVLVKGEAIDFDSNGRPTRTVGVVLDINGEKNESEKRIRDHKILQIAVDAAPQRFFWKDRNCIYLGCSDKFASDAGVRNPSDIVGKTDYELV